MNAQQKVFRVRRNYNQWVANQTLEDYALRFTAKSARRWSAGRVSNTALGAISFLALEAIGGAITISYGFSNAVAAIMVVGLIIFLTGLPISYHAAKQGTDIDLLTRGAGFGYIGSTITSLIYASFTFIFFALEAAILALALELTLNIPLSIGYVISSVIIIPLVTHGITLISRFQVWTQPLWIILQLIPLICIAYQYEEAFDLWVNYQPRGESTSVNQGFNILAFGAASAVIFSLIAQIGEQVDFLRFLPHRDKPTFRWWFAMLSAGPGWILVGVLKILIGSFLAVLALSHGFSETEATDPNHMYLTAFSYMTQSPEFNLVLLGVFVVVSQLKINVTNAYAGSIAWSNFFSRLTHSHPGRVVWVVFNVGIALVLMEIGIYRVLEEILGSYSIVALAWVGTIVADLTINRPLGLRPKTMEFKRAHLYDINPVGVGSMLIASAIGFICHLGLLGEILDALSSFIALAITFVVSPLLAWSTKGKYYIAREPVVFSTKEEMECCICNNHFEPEDMTYCPAYGGNICSLCCSLDSRCQDMCKTDSRYSEQLIKGLSVIVPHSWVNLLNTRVGNFIGLFLLMIMVISSVLLLIYFQLTVDQNVPIETISHALINVFFILLIVFGVVSWMFTLAHHSRVVAQEESDHQTQLLMAEIEAHKQTDMELQKAKELAESANQAKSRYLTGISHELRSPLNAIMGYAQLLERDTNIPEKRRNALGIISRSSDHLADLIEGLLDISRIEAGRLQLDRRDVNLTVLLDQLVSMFRMQANTKGINLTYKKLSPLPEYVKADEKRLRQVLINLLSNAIKYTHEGEVTFTVSYRNQVANFIIEDTGIGIEESEMERIFRPFERIRKPGQPFVMGTGLGLTITRLLIDIMGGNIEVTSAPNKGSRFTITLMLSSTSPVAASDTIRVISGYHGDPRPILIVDDDPSHRSLLQEILSPLGFPIIQAHDAEHCLTMIQNCEFMQSIFLLDISMPGLSGWELAQRIRSQQPDAVILMISANANTTSPINPPPHDGYLIKPIRPDDLLAQLGRLTNIEWIYEDEVMNLAPQLPPKVSHTSQLDAITKQELIRLAKIGYANGINSLLDELQQQYGSLAVDKERFHEIQQLKKLTSQFQFSEFINRLEALDDNK
ncbi:MAG: ATP-binding protein [Pseudomonadales bacterium]|nr:ATP-binding protein [Pseudomonadales bacterium]